MNRRGPKRPPDLTSIMIDEVEKEGPGAHPTEPLLQAVFERCQREGVSVTMDQVRRQFRDMAGYP